MGNINSLQNKISEVSALDNKWIYCECSFIFSGTWLTELVLDANVDLQGFWCMRAEHRGLHYKQK